MENKLIKGRKGGSSQSRTPVEQPDDLQSVARAKLLLALGEGEFAGELNAQTIFLDGTPLENADGTKNFSGVSWEFRPGSQSQSYIQGMPGSENEINAGIEISSTQAWTHTFTNTQLSAIRLRLKWPSLFKQEDNGDLLGNSVKYLIELQTDGGTWQSVVDSAVTGKTTSGYERCHRIDLPAAQTSWTLRLRKISVDANSAKIGDKMSLESYTEVIDAKLSYPNTALLYIEFDSSQFGSSIPQIACEPRGRVIRVPDNYDPETRSYSGIWSGTFKWAWSDNPAWVFYDLVVNDRFGLGHRLSTANIDKWMLYQVAQYCDQPVPDGKGGDGTEPRYVCNIYIQDRNEAYTVLRDIAAIFRGMTYSGGDQIVCMADMPRDIDFNYTRANVLDGKFVYSSSTSKSRYTSALVSWSDPDNAYSDAMEPVFEKDLVARYGFNQLEVTAIGCTRQSEANRKGRWAILTNNKDRVVTFSVGLDGNIPQPGYIITVADELLSGKVNGGRIRAVEGRVITLDRIPDASVGDRLIVNLPSGVSQSRSIAAIDDSTITVTAGYSESPEPEGVWVVESGTLYAQQYRVVSVADNNDGTFTISAASHDPDKYARIDTGVVIDQRPVSVIPPGNQAAPQEIVIETFSVVNQGIHVDHMRVNWSPAANAVAYEAQWRRDNGNWVNVPRGSTTSFEVSGVYAGRYLVRVRAINAAEISSGWAYSQETTLAGKVGKPAAIAGLTASADIVFGINLNWGFGQGTADGLKTSLYVSGSADLADETLLADVPYPQNSYAITGLAAGVRRWFRAVFSDKSGNRSDYCNAVIGQASTDAEEITSYLTGKITETELGQELLAEIGGKVTQGDIDDAISGVQNSLNDVQQTVDNAIQETQKALDDTQKSIADTEASLQESISQTEQLVAEARAQAEALAADAQAQAQQALDLAQSQFNDALVQEARERTEAIADEARARADAILNEKNERVATIENTRTIVQSNYDSLAQMISQVSAGTGEQFDSAKIWYFDKGIEGWNGAANPDIPGWVEGGWIRPADKTPAAVASPNDLDIDGDKYNFIKLRVKKVGNPRWAGKLWTLSPQATGWENARTLNFPEPDYDVDGVATFNIADVPSEGVIRRFRIDLAAAQTENDYFLIDYIATGRPAPGASVGMVEEERTARANADAAQAVARETLATQLRGGYTGNDVNQVSAGLIYSERQARVAADRAEATARQALETKVDDSVSEIQTELSTLNTRTEAQATQITNLRSDLNTQNTSLTNKINAKADASALTALTTRVSATEGNITNQSSSITQLNNNLITLNAGVSALTNDLKTAVNTPNNLLSNASFERALSDWSITGTVAAWDYLNAVNPVSGLRIARYISPKATVGAGTNNAQISQTVKFVAGRTYNISCWYRHEGGSVLSDSANHKLRIANSTNVLLAAALFDVTKTAWTKSSISWTSAATGDHIIGIYASLNGGNLYIDDVVVEDVTNAANISANANAISGLSSTVTQLDNTITSQGTQITQLKNDLSATNAEVAKKANGTAVTALTNRVTKTETDIAAHQSSITSLSGRLTTAENNITNKADASALSLLQTTVTQQGNKVSSQGESITLLDNSIGYLSGMGDNLIPNFDFKNGTGLWQQAIGDNRNTVEWGANFGDGGPGVILTKGSTTSNPSLRTPTGAGGVLAPFPTEPGRKYQVTVKAKGISGHKTLLMRLVSIAEDGSESYNEVRSVFGDEWTEYSGVVTSTTVAKQAKLYLFPYSGSASSLGAVAISHVKLVDITDTLKIETNASAISALSSRVTDNEARADSLTSISASLQKSAGNVWHDGSFESFATGTQFNNGVNAVIVDSPVFEGARALKLTRSASESGNADRTLGSYFSVRGNAVFSFEARIRASNMPSTGTFVMGLTVVDRRTAGTNYSSWPAAFSSTLSTANSGGGLSSEPLKNDAWVKVAGVCRVPVDSDSRQYSQGIVWFSIRDSLGSSGRGWSAYVDDLVIREVSEAYEAQKAATANASAISGLTTRVTNTEGKIESQSSSITNLNASITGINGALQDYAASGDAITTNPRFINGLTGWQLSGSSQVVWSNNEGENKGAAAKLINSTSAGATLYTVYIPVIGSRRYRIVVRAKANAAAEIRLRRRYRLDNISSSDVLGDYTANVTTSWQTFSYDYAAFPANAAFARFDIVNNTAHTTIYLDHVYVLDITDTLENQANASALSSLATRVESTEGKINSQAKSITKLETDVAGKANQTAVNALESSVSKQGDTIASQGINITRLNNSVNFIAGSGDSLIPNGDFSSGIELWQKATGDTNNSFIWGASFGDGGAGVVLTKGSATSNPSFRAPAKTDGTLAPFPTQAGRKYQIQVRAKGISGHKTLLMRLVSIAKDKTESYNEVRKVLGDDWEDFTGTLSATSVATMAKLYLFPYSGTTTSLGSVAVSNVRLVDITDALNINANASAINSLDTRVSNAEGRIENQASSITSLNTSISGLNGAIQDLASTGDSIISNTRFINGLSGWLQSSSTNVFWSGNEGENNSAACKLKVGSSGNATLYTVYIPVNGSRRYRINIRVKANSGTVQMILRRRTKNLNLTAADVVVDAPTQGISTTWTSYSYDFPATSGTAAFVRFDIINASINSTLIIDNVTVFDVTDALALETKADASAVTSLSSRVTVAENNITSQSNNLVSLSNTLSSMTGQGDNIVPNPLFTSGTDMWNLTTGGVGNTIVWGSSSGNSGPGVIITKGQASNPSIRTPADLSGKQTWFPAAPQRKYRATIVAKTSLSRFLVRLVSSLNGSQSLNDVYVTPTSTSFATYEVTLSTTTACDSANLNIFAYDGNGNNYGTLTVSSVYLRDVTNELGISSNAGAISSLDSRVTSAEGKITSQSLQTTSLSSGLSAVIADMNAATNTPETMVANCSFERGLDAWTLTGSAWDTIAATNPRSGARIARLSASAGNSTIQQNVVFVEGRTYRIGVYARRSNDMAVRDANNNKLRLGNSAGTLLKAVEWTSSSVSTVATWTFTSFDYVCSTTGIYTIGLFGSLSSGYMYFDDVSVSDITNEIAINTKADASALTSLRTRVDNVEGSISSQSSSITQLNSSVSRLADDVKSIGSTGDSLTPNPNFINGLGGWQSGNGTFTWGAAIGDGGSGVQITSPAGYNAWIGTGFIPVSPGRRYRFIIRAKLVSGSNTVLKLRQVNGTTYSGGTITNRDTDRNLTTSWGTFTHDFVAASDTTLSAKFQIFAMGATSGNKTIIVSTFAVYDVTDTLALDGKASASALSLLETTVEEQGKTLTAQAKKVDLLSTTAGENTAQIQENAKAIASLDGTVSASWTMKVEVDSNKNKIVSGIALGADSQGNSQFLVNAQRFALITANNGTVSTPFAVENGQTFINSAFIKDASISFGKISDSLQSTNYIAGNNGWKLPKSGNAEFNNVTVRGNVQAISGKLSNVVIDETCTVNRLYAEKIYGDIISATDYFSDKVWGNNSFSDKEVRYHIATVNGAPFKRVLLFLGSSYMYARWRQFITIRCDESILWEWDCGNNGMNRTFDNFVLQIPPSGYDRQHKITIQFPNRNDYAYLKFTGVALLYKAGDSISLV
ncbi:TipJ family phage tail tip protein [Entomohabitans teleogrylli]|uniref:TipJ family phage tail tip protein n=1 Tax=Entomohabitans teleogrylli TaxID=1384589 RepID=UPI00073D9504|nr:carbohydrate binding domain-containing protein [Entomohabitans teleogrylli]